MYGYNQIIILCGICVWCNDYTIGCEILSLGINLSLMCIIQVANTDSGGKVLGSPGKHLSEKEFMDAITEADGPGKTIYRLPEYVTSFLLAKDVELEFSNMQRSSFRDTLSTFTHHSSHVSFFCFSASFSSTKSNYKSRSSVHRKANGMVIKMPGAQIIGYYTQKLPKFPATQ